MTLALSPLASHVNRPVVGRHGRQRRRANVYDAAGAQTSGVRVADVNGDGFADSVLGTGPGTPNQVKVIGGKDKTTNLLAPFAPFGAFTGGVNAG